MMTRATIEAALATWAIAATSANVIIGWPAGPRPSLPYITIRVLSARDVGMPHFSAEINEYGEQEVMTSRMVTAVLDAFGAGALDLLNKLTDSMWDDAIRAALVADGLVPYPCDNAADLTQFLESEPEERAHAEMQFGFIDVSMHTPGWIQRVTGTATIASNPAASFTIDVGTAS